MNKWKALAILFTLFSFGMLRETFRIFTSDASDIVPNRKGLIVMALTITSVVVFFTVWFWRKASDKRLY